MTQRPTTPVDNDENLDFWGGQSPPNHMNEAVESDGENHSEESSDSSSDEIMEDDEPDDDEEDALDLPGHR